LNLYLFTPWVQSLPRTRSGAKPWPEFFAAMAQMTDNSKRTGTAIEAHVRPKV
jgi:hypothetical protein